MSLTARWGRTPIGWKWVLWGVCILLIVYWVAIPYYRVQQRNKILLELTRQETAYSATRQVCIWNNERFQRAITKHRGGDTSHPHWRFPLKTGESWYAVLLKEGMDPKTLRCPFSKADLGYACIEDLLPPGTTLDVVDVDDLPLIWDKDAHPPRPCGYVEYPDGRILCRPDPWYVINSGIGGQGSQCTNYTQAEFEALMIRTKEYIRLHAKPIAPPAP